MNTYLEIALNRRLRDQGKLITSTTIPPDWTPDPMVLSDARWLSEHEPLGGYKNQMKNRMTGRYALKTIHPR